MTKLRTGVVASLAVCTLQVGACTFGPSEAAFSPTDASTQPSNGGSDTTGTGGAHTGGRGTGGMRNTGGSGTSGAGGAATGGASNGSGGVSGGGSGAAGGGAGGSASGGDGSGGGGGGGAGGAETGGAPSGGAGGSPVDASVGDADAGGDGSTEGGGSCGSCPKGQYCDTASQVCKAGCGSAASCASGSCAATHDCDRCVSDSECAEGRVCSTGRCLAPCANTTDCPTGFTCCNDRCADTSRDHQHCASCTSSCGTTDFCSATGCKQGSISTVCETPRVTILLDGASTDEALAPLVASALTSGCGTAHVTVTESETASNAVNPTTGQPVAGAQDLIVEIGSPYSQKVGRYIEDAGFSRAYDLGDAAKAGFYGRAADGGTDPEIIVIPVSSYSETHDLFKIEMVLDPISGTRVLQIYGVFEWGTQAAEWFFENRMLPNLSAYPLRYYVYEWTHGDAGTNPGANDTFRLVASGN